MYITQRPPPVLNQPKSSLTDPVDPAPHSMGHALFGWPELVEPLKNHTAVKRITPTGRAMDISRNFRGHEGNQLPKNTFYTKAPLKWKPGGQKRDTPKPFYKSYSMRNSANH